MEERTREAQRLDKVLQGAGIQLSSVASDPLGVSGRAMLAGLVAGSRDSEVLAELAKGTLRKKIPLLRQALEGRFDAHHGLLVAEILGQLDALDSSIGRLSEEIDRLIAPFADARDRLMTIPGVDKRAAEAVIGVDMSRFPTAGHLASWAGMCPGQHESAGKSTHGTARRGDSWLARVLATSAMSAAQSKDTYLAAQYRRIVHIEAGDGRARLSATRSSSPAGTSSRVSTPPSRSSDLTTSTAAAAPKPSLAASSPTCVPSAGKSSSTRTEPPSSDRRQPEPPTFGPSPPRAVGLARRARRGPLTVVFHVRR